MKYNFIGLLAIATGLTTGGLALARLVRYAWHRHGWLWVVIVSVLILGVLVYAGLQALGAGRITARQIEAARMAVNRHVKRSGKLWIRIFPDTPVTKKPAETRMGKGKGSPEEWVALIKPGKVLYEISGVSESVAKQAFTLAAHKLGIPTKFIQRGGAL